MGKCKLNKSVPPQLAFWSGCFAVAVETLTRKLCTIVSFISVISISTIWEKQNGLTNVYGYKKEVVLDRTDASGCTEYSCLSTTEDEAS